MSVDLYPFGLIKSTCDTSGQEGGIGQYTVPPCTTKRITTNLKNKQNCQKIKLYGNPTTKEVKKKHLFRLVGGVETDI